MFISELNIIQPCVVTIFKPLKTEWVNVARQYSHPESPHIAKWNFAPIFSGVFKKSITSKTIKKCFECCGLFRFNPEIVDFKISVDIIISAYYLGVLKS